MATLNPDALIVLLPPRERLPDPAGPLATAIGRAERLPASEAGQRAQLERHVALLPRRWPMAAITRQLDVGDAAGAHWLRADPAYVEADLNAGRMLACGNLGLTATEAEALLRPLRPVFGDAGFAISAPVPERWYVQLPAGAKLPDFHDPEQVLGDDLLEHLPSGDTGRRWRALLNEAQVLLHNHPLNAERRARSRTPVNSLWFWGGGGLPDHVEMRVRRVVTDTVDMAALAGLAGVEVLPLGEGPDRVLAEPASTLLDLRRLGDGESLQGDWLLPAVAALASGTLDTMLFDLVDGTGYRLTRPQRWRFWRRPKSW